MPLDLFATDRSDDALHPSFINVRDDVRMRPAKAQLMEVAALAGKFREFVKQQAVSEVELETPDTDRDEFVL